MTTVSPNATAAGIVMAWVSVALELVAVAADDARGPIVTSVPEPCAEEAPLDEGGVVLEATIQTGVVHLG